MNEHLEQAMEPEDAHREEFVIDNMRKATWASYKARAAAREIERIKAWKKETIREVERAAEENLTGPEGTLERMKGLLAAYLIRLRREGRNKKSLALPGGRIALHKRQPKLTYDDEKGLIAWLEQSGHDGFVKKSLDEPQFKKALTRVEGGVVLTATGEMIEGIDLTQPEDSVNFSPMKEDDDAERTGEGEDQGEGPAA